MVGKRSKVNIDAQAEMKRYKANQSSFVIFGGKEMGNWAVLCENDQLQARRQPSVGPSVRHNFEI